MSTEAARVPPRPSVPPLPTQLPSAVHPLPATAPPPAPSARFPDTPPPRMAMNASDGPPARRETGVGSGAGDHDTPPPEPEPPLTRGGQAKRVPLPPEETPTETTTRLRPVPPAPDTPPVPLAPPVPPVPHTPPAPSLRRPTGAVDLTPRPDTARSPFVRAARPAHYDDSTTRLRPVTAGPRHRRAAAAACLVLGLGLIGGATTGSVLTGDDAGAASARSAYRDAAQLWHSVPVDRLFPPTVKGKGAGPGGADRTWTRVAVAPDSGCATAFDPLLHKALRSAGCLRLLRATYTDATRSSVTTVGLLFTRADTEASGALRTRFTDQGLDRRTDLMPRTYAAKGTLAEDFGDAQRASWTIEVLTDAPVVVYAVSGFADGRTVTAPEPAAEAMKPGATSAPAQAGLGDEAEGLADRIERGLHAAAEKPTGQSS